MVAGKTYLRERKLIKVQSGGDIIKYTPDLIWFDIFRFELMNFIFD